MSGRGQAVSSQSVATPSDIEIVRFVVPYPPDATSAVLNLTGIFYVPVDAVLGDVVITLETPSAHSLQYSIKYCRGYPSVTTFNTLSGTMTLSAGNKQAIVTPTWADDVQIGDYLRLDASAGDGSDASNLSILLLRQVP